MREFDDDEASSPYSRKVGDRLRVIRRQKRLSLQEVEATSNDEFKASVLGAYERGERAISVPRLRRLASFYNVPVDQLLPRDDADAGVVDLTDTRSANDPATSVTIDLVRLRDSDAQGSDLLMRYLQMIQVQRQDFNGRMLTVRRDDLRAIACILDTSVDATLGRLESLGLSLTT